MFRRLSYSIFREFHQRQLDKNNLPIISSLFSKCQYHNDQKNDRVKFYVDDLFKQKLLPSKTIKYKSLNELQQRIATILERFDYGMYEHNLNSDEFEQYESTRQKFHLKSEEIFEILSSQTDDHDDRLLNYFINNRCQIYEKFLLRLSKSQERLSQKQDQYDDDDFRTGIWSNQGELKYGLWHNCLFTKMKRSSASRLFDRRMTSMAMYCPSTPRLWIDLDYVMDQDFFQTRKILNDMRNLLAANKYKTTIIPFRIEFVRSNHQQSNNNFDKIIGNFFTWWNDPKHHQYVVHHKKPVQLLRKDLNEKLIYFTPNAKIPLKMSELLDERNIFIIPCHNSRNLRDPVFNRINRLPNQSKSIIVRRLPTMEHIVWNRFHGVLSWSLFLTILHDIRHNHMDDWNIVFKRHLLENELIKTDDELSREMTHSQQIRMKREQQIKNFIQSKSMNVDGEKRTVKIVK